MKKIYFKLTVIATVIITITLGNYSVAQNVGIASANITPHASAGLEIQFTNKGLLIPRVALTSLTAVGPVPSPANALLVYNTATTGTAPNNVTPGFYYWTTSPAKWNRLQNGDDSGKAWQISGNAGTSATNNFIGTTDPQTLTVRTNNVERFKFNTSGQLISMGNGAVGTPSYGFSTQSNTGMYMAAAGQLNWTVGGVERMRLGASYLRTTFFGSVGAPAYSFVGRTNTGMWSPAANVLGFSTTGVERFRIPNAAQVHAMANGTAAAPFYSWSSDVNMGIFRAGTDILGFSTNGSEKMRIISAGNVGIGTTAPNSAAILDVASANKGVLIPRVALTALNNNSPIGSSITNSMLVYNTATAGTYPNEVAPGYYYWQSNRWVRMNAKNLQVYYHPPVDVGAGGLYAFTGTLPGISPEDAVAINLVGNWGSVPLVNIWSVEARTDEVRFVVENMTSYTNYIDMDFCVIIIKP